MTKQQKYTAIQLNFTTTEYPNTTKVAMKDGVNHYGFFDEKGFENDKELSRNYQFWFVPNHNIGAYQAELRATAKKNSKFCILIDVDEIALIVYQTPNKHVLNSMAF